MNRVKIIECPRDAMQGMRQFIPTAQKAAYINLLLKAGFDTVDFGSFVSPEAIPQLRDTAEVLEQLDTGGPTSLLAIVANKRGAEAAASFGAIRYLGFPFSVSEEFQKRNTNSTIQESVDRVAAIQELCVQKGKELVIYISMGFGNPYGELWSPELVIRWVEKIAGMGIRIIALSDTIGVSAPDNITALFSALIPAFPAVEFGAHLHSRPETALVKVEAAFLAGCRRFDAAMKGFGGCPMADDELVGNLATESLVAYFQQKNIETGIIEDSLKKALEKSGEIFGGIL